MSTDITASGSYTATQVVPLRSVSAEAITAQPATSVASSTGFAPRPSPVSLLDPSTGLVVLEFYNSQGTETESLPTKKQLESYRLNEPSYSVFQPAIHDGTVPPAAASVSGASTSGSTGSAAQGSSVQQQSTVSAPAVAQPGAAAVSTGGSLKTQA